ncbi:MAG: hypothetical protein ACE5HX_02195 [bacterium]
MIRHFLASRNFARKISTAKNIFKKYIQSKQFAFWLVAAGFFLFPITINSQTSHVLATVVKTKGNFLLIRDNKILVNTIPRNLIYENDKIITLKDGYVALLLLDDKELTAIRPYSNITLIKKSNKFSKLKEAVTRTLCLLGGKSFNNFFEPIGSAVAGVKG